MGTIAEKVADAIEKARQYREIAKKLHSGNELVLAELYKSAARQQEDIKDQLIFQWFS